MKTRWINYYSLNVVWLLLFLSACAGPDMQQGRMKEADQTAQWLGVQEKDARDMRVAVIVPSLTRDGEEIDHEYWRGETLLFMCRLFGGATVLSAEGGWIDDEKGRQLIKEHVCVVESYLPSRNWNRENAGQLRDYLKRMRREAQQGAIGVVVNGRFLLIDN